MMLEMFTVLLSRVGNEKVIKSDEGCECLHSSLQLLTTVTLPSPETLLFEVSATQFSRYSRHKC